MDEEIRDKARAKVEKERRKHKVKDEYMPVPDGDDGIEEIKIGAIVRPKIEEGKKKEVPEKKRTKKEFQDELHALVNASDVLIEVMDARVPSECRLTKLEAYCAGKGKKVVLLLNKADLVPAYASSLSSSGIVLRWSSGWRSWGRNCRR